MTYSPVQWETSTAQNVSISGGTVTGTGSGSYTSNCRSTAAITNSDSIQITASTGANFMAGLGLDPYSASPHTYTAVEYAFHFDASANTWYIFENGVNKNSFSGTQSDVPRISRVSSSIYYYLNNTLKYTSTNSTSADLYAQVTMSDNSSVTMTTNATQASTGGGGSSSDTGSIDLTADGSSIEHILYLNTVVPK